MPPTVESVLSSVALFEGVRDEELSRLARGFERVELPPRQVVFDIGDPADALFVVVEGAVTLFRLRRDGAPWVLARLEPGDLFGELGLFSGEPREEAARAELPSVVLALRGEPLDRLAERHPMVSLKLNLLAAQGHRRIAGLSLHHAMRAAVRYRVHREVRLEPAVGEALDATLVDLSETGARFLGAPPSWRPGTRVEGSMILAGRRFELAGTVAWGQEGSAGLAFDGPQPELLRFVQRTIGSEIL